MLHQWIVLTITYPGVLWAGSLEKRRFDGWPAMVHPSSLSSARAAFLSTQLRTGYFKFPVSKSHLSPKRSSQPNCIYVLLQQFRSRNIPDRSNRDAEIHKSCGKLCGKLCFSQDNLLTGFCLDHIAQIQCNETDIQLALFCYGRSWENGRQRLSKWVGQADAMDRERGYFI